MSISAYKTLTKAPASGAPLVFAFHGTGGDEHQFAQLVGQILPDAGLVSPRGDVSEHGALRFFRRTGEGVYDMADLAERTEKMAGFVAAHKAAHPDSPVYGLGYSNGANILAAVILKHPDLFDRAALLHPLIPWQPADNPGLAESEILITAGRRDPIAPVPYTDRLADYLKSQNGKVTLQYHDGGHEIRADELAALRTFLTAQAPAEVRKPTANRVA
ncbi:putative hydrolase MhqD [Hartmannibacter diazotrophicus]|uniref:Putative hydrolase MhqD n=1 Tax=Hartmannibacter diazotrophicus TaxID=1482074 RepID=A0A2C9D3F8_9HYPH|nr:alpha/beta hydrolase [Hartmannibacter diazotrophicus]SON54005.1 putative hydrolase MhqD [Hartmannibacter diazotrophicus]